MAASLLCMLCILLDLSNNADKPKVAHVGCLAESLPFTVSLLLPPPLSAPPTPPRITIRRQQQLEQQYADASVPVPKPPHWGGFLVKPVAVEFWQGRPSRLHDRLRYSRTDVDSSDWQVDRLYP